MLFIMLTVFISGIPAGIHRGEVLYTDLSGNRLCLGQNILSSEPGSGRNTVSAEEHLYWKECPVEGNQRVIRDNGITVFEADYFSGPFASPEGNGFMVSVPGEILLMDTGGSVLQSWATGEYPGSLASGDGAIWFVSSHDGLLKKLDTAKGSVETVPLSFTPLTVQYSSEMLLLESSQDEYCLCTTGGEEIRRIEGGAYWSYMVLWMEQHGLESIYLGTTWSACTSELSGSWPVVSSTRSAYTNGHILLFNGYYQNHSVICNDSYGNQNLPGWGSYSNGKDVVYDWPGYNNGNTQLIIRQLFRARSQVLSPAGTLVDDRTMGYRKFGPCQYWHEQSTGYCGYSWWTYSTGALPDTCVVEWTPELSTAGMYTIETYIPSSHAGATGIYHIQTQSGWETAYLNQGSYSNQWVTLGTWQLNPSTATVKMGDYTGTQGQYISFDAVRFTLETSVAEENFFVSPGEFSIQANPVPYSSAIGFTTPENFSGDILVYDTAGREVARSTGTLQAETLSPGIYFAVISHQGRSLTARFTVTR